LCDTKPGLVRRWILCSDVGCRTCSFYLHSWGFWNFCVFFRFFLHFKYKIYSFITFCSLWFYAYLILLFPDLFPTLHSNQLEIHYDYVRQSFRNFTSQMMCMVVITFYFWFYYCLSVLQSWFIITFQYMHQRVFAKFTPFITISYPFCPV
jgi:hypothetical protein